jgi:drug/metabolite transporter (DMT)-like permease
MPFDGYKSLMASARAQFAPRIGVDGLPTARFNDFWMGVFWMTLAMALFAGLAAFAKASINSGVHPWQVVFMRNLFAFTAMTPLLYTRGISLVQTENIRLYGVRCSLSVLSMMAWFYALGKIPIGELTAISFLGPLFGTLCAVLILGEVVRARRWTALFVGFAGAMIILRPGSTAFGIGQICAVLAALFGGFLAILVKQLTSRDDPNRIVFLTNAMMTPLSLIPALFVWTWPSADLVPMLLGLGLTAVLGHICLTRAYAALDASLVMTFEFSRLPFSTGIAYLAFGEMIDRWTWIGAFIIFASSVYITRREALLRRQAALAQTPKS